MMVRLFINDDGGLDVDAPFPKKNLVPLGSEYLFDI